MNKIRVLDPATGVHVGILLMTVILFGAVQTLPLLSTLGFEAANLFVTLLGPMFFLAASLNNKNRFKTFILMLSRETPWLGIHLVLFASLLFANGFHSKSCSQGVGLIPFLVISIPPLLLNMSLGLVLACLVRRAWLKIVIVVAVYGIYYSWIVLLWWQQPEFRLLTHASVIISSDLLTGDSLTAAVVGFRASTFMLALAVIWFGISFYGNSPGMFEKSHPRPVFAVAIITLLMLIHVVLHVKSLEALGKRPSDLRRDYQLLAERDGLRVFANALKTSQKSASLILNEARFYKAHIESLVGQVSSAPITIWLHQTDEEKFLYTGAKNVHFALPKHRQIHIAGTNIPHEVLGHELAHIYVGEFSKTWFGIPSSYGIVPNLALTEGLAVALSETLNLEQGMTIVEQAQALYQGNVRIDVSELFSNNPFYFARTHPRAAYIFAGATLSFLLNQVKESERPKKLRELISQGSLLALFADEYELALAMAAFMKKLNEPMPSHAILWAQKSFPQASILTSDCGEKARQDNQMLSRALINQENELIKNIADQLPLMERVRVLDKASEQLLLAGAFSPALNLLKYQQTLVTNQAELAESKLRELDALINLQQFDPAFQLLPTISQEYFFDSYQRLLLVLATLFQDYAHGGEFSELSKSAIGFLFAKSQDVLIKFALFSEQIGRVSFYSPAQISDIPLLSTYIQGRMYLRAGQYERARPMIQQVYNQSALFPELIERETHMMWADTLKGLDNKQAALTIFQDLLSSTKTAGERIYLEDQIERLQFALKH